MPAVALWALSIVLGIQVGAGIFETRVLVPLWSDHPPSSLTAFHAQPLRPDSGKRFWIFLSPVTTLICLANLILAVMSTAEWRVWWLVAAGCGTAVMIATFGYFVPVLLYLARVARQPGHDDAGKIRMWVALNYVRAAVLLFAWIAALKALVRMA